MTTEDELVDEAGRAWPIVGCREVGCDWDTRGCQFGAAPCIAPATEACRVVELERLQGVERRHATVRYLASRR